MYVNFSLLLQGLLIGFSIAAPLGPIGVLCIRRTLTSGRAVGFVTGLGAAIADAIYSSIAGFGLIIVSTFLVNHQIWFRLAGSIFLVYLGLKIILFKTGSSIKPTNKNSLLGAFSTTFFLTLTNPLTLFLFLGVFTGLGIGIGSYGGVSHAMVFILGVFSGSSLWWLILSSLTTLLRDKILSWGLRWINWASGLIILGFGLAAFISLRYSLPVTSSTGLKAKIQSQIVAAPSPDSDQNSSQGYSRAEGPVPFSFPQDSGSHDDFQTEWWYYTGNLKTADNEHFGYQLTFFRRALIPPTERVERSSNWVSEQVYMAHFALTDVGNQHFQAFERLARGSAGLAGAQASPYRVWLEDWIVQETGEKTYWLQAQQEELSIDLYLEDTKGYILQGTRGYSQKGPQKGNASYYISQTRLATKGNIRVGSKIYRVSGSSWMDHEFSTSALAADQVGWDWFAIQLDHEQGTNRPGKFQNPVNTNLPGELMVFQIRNSNGSIDPFSSGIFIGADGSTRRLSRQDFEITVLDTWSSPNTNAVYPSHWKVVVPSLYLTLKVEPYINDQELILSLQYWEGAVKITGEFAGQHVIGNGYVELTGYSGSMAGEF